MRPRPQIILLLGVLVTVLWPSLLVAREDDKKPVLDPASACGETLEVCVERQRQKWKARGTLGVKIHAPHAEGAEEHPGQEDHRNDKWYVELIDPTGAAKAAGLRPGDQLLEWAGRPMPAGRDVFDTWTEATNIGEKITIKVSRGGEHKTFTLTAKKPDPWVIEAWLMSYVQQNYGEEEYKAYRQKVMSRMQRP